MKKNCCGKAAKVVAIVGALNWGLVGAFNFNLVHAIFGSVLWLERLVYVVVGIAGVVLAVKMAKSCSSGSCGSSKGGCCGGSKMMDNAMEMKKEGSCKGGSCSGKGGSCSGK